MKNSLFNLKMTIPTGRFYINTEMSRKLNIQTGDGIMLSFNYKEKRILIWKENDEDSIKLRINNDLDVRFTNKNLMFHIIKCLQLDCSKPSYDLSMIKFNNNKYQILWKQEN